MDKSNKVITILIITFLIMGFTPFGNSSGDSPPTKGRTLSGPTPPPCNIDDNGIYPCDWIIDTPPNNPENVSFENIKIKGNITITGGSMLRMTQSAKITQLFSNDQRFTFEVKEDGSLIVEKKSTLTTDRFISKPTSDVTFTDSTLKAGGYVNISSSVLKIDKGLVENIGIKGKMGKPGGDSYLILEAETSSFSDSTLRNFGGEGGLGDIGVPGGKGGDSFATIFASAGVISKATINISGGDGGEGKDSFSGVGSSGGIGGSAIANIYTPPNYPHSIIGSSISVFGGHGGKGGNGARGQSTPGKDGGRGEMGGNAKLLLSGKNVVIREGSDILIQGGISGKGGSGGEASASVGGNGGDSGRGGNAYMELTSNGPLLVSDSMVQALGGLGADGGFFGLGGESMGSAGNAGGGGDASLIFNVDGNYVGTNASIQAVGGQGGRGGLGALTAGDGGDGGDGVCTINTTSTFLHTGTVSRLAMFGSAGGEGGYGGDAVGNSGTGGGLRGRGGSGGASFTTIYAPWSIDFTNAHIRGYRSSGGQGGKWGSIGFAQISMLTNYFNSTDGLSDYTIEGFNESDHGIMKNTTVNAPQRAFVPPEETNVKVEVYWNVYVKIPKANASESWNVAVYNGNLKDDDKVDEKTVLGPNNVAKFFLLGEIVTAQGSQLLNYTIHGTLPGSNMETKAQNVVLTRNKNVSLQPSGNYYAPHIDISSPDDNQVIRSANLAPCREPTSAEIASGKSPPSCLKIEGDAWEDDRDSEGLIENVWVEIYHEASATRELFNLASTPSVIIRQPNTRRTQWFVDWEIGTFDDEHNHFKYRAGEWTITVRSYDGAWWSDNVDREGKVYKRVISIVHPPPLKPIPKVGAGPDQDATFEYQNNGVMVTFNDANVSVPDDGIPIIRVEWDYNNDAKPDWSMLMSCDTGQTCVVPETKYLFTTPGLQTSNFCVFDTLGRKKCDDLRVHIERTDPPNPDPITTFLNNYFPIIAFFFILIMIVAILVNVASRKRVQQRYESLASTHKVEIHSDTCDRCSDPLDEGSDFCRRCDATDYLSSIQQVILEIKNSGVNVIDAEAKLEDAVNLYDQGQYDQAKQKAYEAQEEANMLRGDYVETTETISQWEARLNAIKDDIGDVDLGQTEADTTIYHARLALGRGDFVMVHDYLEKLEPQLEDVKALGRVKGVEVRLNMVEKMIDNVKTRGIKVLEAEDLLRKARDTYKKEDYEAAYTQAGRAEKAIKKTNMMFIESSEHITQVEERLGKAQKKGESDIVNKVTPIFEKMKTAFIDGLYTNVLELWKEADPILPAARKARKIAWNKEASRLTTEGTKAAESETAERPSEAMETTIQAAEERAAAEASGPSQNEAAQYVQLCYDRIILARENDIDTSDADELYAEARKALEADNYEVALDYSKNAIFLMEELLSVLGVELTEAKIETQEPTREEKAKEEAAEKASPNCPSCGKTIKERWETCPYCGVALIEESEPETPVEDVQTYAKDDGGEIRPYGPEGEQRVVQTQEYSEQEVKVKEYSQAEAEGGYRDETTPTKEYVTEDSIKPEGEIEPLTPKQEETPPTVEEKPKCPNCNKDIKSKWKTCPYCGADTIEEKTEDAGPVEDAKPKCPSCGKDVKAKWKTCPYCGAAMDLKKEEKKPEEETKPTCPHCNKDVKPRWKTCPYCGGAI